MRPNRVAPGAQNPQGNTSGASGIYGSGDMPSLERPNVPTPSAASKGFKQEQMEKELLEAGATIKGLEKRLRDLEKQIGSLQTQLQEGKAALTEENKRARQALTDENERIKKAFSEEIESIKRTSKADKKSMEMAFNNEKQSIYARGMADGQAEANAKTEADMENYKMKHIEMQKEVEKVKAEFPEMRRQLTLEVSRREAEVNSVIGRLDNELQAKRKQAEAECKRIYRKANDWESEVKLRANDINQQLENWAMDLRLREDALRGRKAQRSSYQGYRDLYSTVHAERKGLVQSLGIVQTQLSQEREKLEREQHDQNTDSHAVPGHSLSTSQLKNLERGLEVICTKLTSLDEELQHVGHVSRLKTNMTRFKDTGVAGEVMSACIYPTSIEPLRNVSKLTRQDIGYTEEQIKNASNATIRDELQAKKYAHFAEKLAVDQAVALAYLEHDVSVFQTMKSESYVNKATQLATFDLQRQVTRFSAHALEGHQVNVKGEEEWTRLRGTRDVIHRLVKKQALLLEIMGQQEEDEKRLDGNIDDRIADLLDEIRALRASHAVSRREVRDAFKRASRTSAPLPSGPKSKSPRSTKRSRTPYRSLRLSSDVGKTFEDSDKSVIVQGEHKVFSLKRLIQTAQKAGDSEREITLGQQLSQARSSLSDTIFRRYARAQAALGPKTPENAEAHERLEYQINRHKMSQLNYELGKAKVAGEMDDLKSLRREKGNLLGQILNYKASSNTSRLPVNSKNVGKHESPDRELSASKSSSRTRRQRLRKSRTSRRESLPSEGNGMQSMVDDALSQLEHADSKGSGYSASNARDGSMGTSSSRMATAENTSKESALNNNDPGGASFVNFKPTSPQQAIYQPAGRKQLHDHGLWADFLSQQQARESAVLSISNTSSVDQNDGRLYASDSGAVDRHSSELCPEGARDDHSAKNHMYAASASLSSETSSLPPPHNDTTNTAETMAGQDAEFVPTYEISSEDKKNALIASRNSTASFWKYNLYKNASGETPTRHYCTTYEQAEAQVEKFRGANVVGFDLEWERFKSKAGEDSAKRCVSLMQLAAEDKVALFHLAVFRGGDSVAEMVPPSLRAMLEDPSVIKVGVNIGGDATRLRNVFGIEMQGNIELSHLYKLVKFGESQPEKVNKGLQSLAKQVEEVLHLPLAKGAVRTSSWSKRLNLQQIEYATSDAYAGLRLYYELERRRKAMDPRPPRPAFHELNMPITLPDGEPALPKSRRAKPMAEEIDESLDEPLEEAAALQEQDDASEVSDDIYDDPADLEAFDEFLESQDTNANASLPEITYPKLPPLEDVSSDSSDVDDGSSLPSDPITKPSTTSRVFHSPEAATADAWATAWQAQLPTTQIGRVSLANLRAYHLWHHQGFGLQEITALLRKEPLALSTVVSYIAEVLQKEELDFDAERVREVRARLPASVRSRYAKLYAATDTDRA